MIEKFKFKKSIILIGILSILSFIPITANSSSHVKIELPQLKFETCLLYPVCSFYILDKSKENALRSGFRHDRVRSDRVGGQDFVMAEFVATDFVVRISSVTEFVMT